jgi:NAD(P)-dependent dehydrogenase (short-subunit alcohol dehydrogenase family)
MTNGHGRLTGKVAVVTGGGSGIGRATVELFSEHGATVVFIDRSEDGGKAVEEAVRSSGGEALFVTGDVSRVDDVRRLVQETVDRYGAIDVLFNNAGYNLHQSITDVAETDWRQLLDVNLGGVFLTSKEALPHMVRAGQGSIIHNASSLGLIGFPKVPAYAASKGAIIALTRQMAVDYGASGVRVNCVCPGPTRTPRIERDIASGAITPEVEQRMTADVVLGRLAEPREVASAVLFLASDEASYITGVALPVDGGQTAH